MEEKSCRAGSWNQRAHPPPRRKDAVADLGIVDDGLRWLRPPDPVPDQLDQERVAAGPGHRLIKRVLVDPPTSGFDRLTQRLGDIRCVHTAEVVPVRPAKEGHDVVVEQVLDRRGRPDATTAIARSSRKQCWTTTLRARRSSRSPP